MKRIHEGYRRREQEVYYRAMLKGFERLNTPDSYNIWSWIGGTAVSVISSAGTGYYDYKASREQIHRELGNDTWQLTKEEIEACNKLQTTLLNSSWTLLSKYNLPNEYRLTQENVREFLSVMNEPDSSKRLGRLKFIERKFRVYPPYWFFRADAAMNAGNESECRKCFERFNEVWRPVLNYDPYKLEAVKYEIRELAKKGVPSGENADRIRELVEMIRDYAPPSDWVSNLFAGIIYFALGEKEEAINCIEYGNVVPGYETEISGVILSHMKRGVIALATLPEEFKGLFEKKEASAYDTYDSWGIVHKDEVLNNHPRFANVRKQIDELGEDEDKLMAPLYRDYEQAVHEVAVKKKLTLVLDRFVVLIGGIDITQDVINELSRIAR